MLKRLIVCIAVLLFCDACYAQSYYFKHYQAENGLSYNSVFCTTQDSKGFMWFGTRDGLNRFDGYTFKVFRHDPDNLNTIGNNFIFSLCNGSNGSLWVGTSKGLYSYDPQNETFKLLPATKGRGVRSVQLDKNGNLWYIMGFDLCRYNINTKILKTYNAASYFAATSTITAADGTVWVATNDGLIQQYNKAKDTFTATDVFGYAAHSRSKRIEVIYDTGKGSLLVGTANKGIKLFDIRRKTYTDIITYNSDRTDIYARDFVRSSNDEYWCATESGVYIYNIASGKIIQLRKSDNNPYSLSDNAVYSLFKDREGGIWAGTYFGGINFYPQNYNSFQKFFHINGQNSISGNIVREICQDKYGKIWIGTEDAGLNKYDPLTGRFTNFNPTGATGSISYTNIHGLLVRDNELWVGTYEHGLDVMDIRTGRIIRHYESSTQKNALKSNFIVTLNQAANGDVLVGTSNGLFTYHVATDDFDEFGDLSGKFIYALLQDRRGILWVGTVSSGVYHYDLKTGEKGRLQNIAGNKNSLSSNTITSMMEDSENRIWIATENGGLSRLSSDRKTIDRITTKEGLPANYVFKVIEDHAKNIWITTSQGLACIVRGKGNIKIFKRSNGLLNDQFNYNSGFIDKEGYLYFGGTQGLIRFNPATMSDDRFDPQVFITGLQVNNKDVSVGEQNSILTHSVIVADEIKLKHDESTVSIDFAALSFTSPEMTGYQYKLEGLDKDWTVLKTNRRVYFTELPAGEYHFKVKALKADGSYYKHMAALKIIVLPPFWASNFAYILYTFIVLSLIYAGIRFYHNRITEKNQRKIDLLENEKEREIYEAKIDFFTNITHEIRTPLTLIQGPLELIKNAADLPEVKSHLGVMDRNTKRLLSLTNQLLDFRKSESKGFSLNFIKTSITQLLDDCFERFNLAAAQKQLSLKFVKPDIEVWAYVDHEALNKVLSNLFTNAINYADSEITVTLFDVAIGTDFFKVEIKNDGNHIPYHLREKIFEPFFRLKGAEKQIGTGIGLSLARSLTQLHNGTLTLQQSDELNVFQLQLPVHQDREFELIVDHVDLPNAINAVVDDDPAKMTILVVDDTVEILQFLTQALNKRYSVITAINGAEAIAKLGQHNVQLIISDVMMPVMNGIDLCKYLKSHLDHSHIPLIMLTAKNTLPSKIEGLESGADAYIEKPFSPEHLLVQIANLLANKAKIKDYFARSPLVNIKTMAYSKADERFLEKMNEVIVANLADTELDIDKIADLLSMSRSTLFRKIKAISNLSPNELINITRLKKAAQLMAEDDHKIYEVSDIVGFSSANVFARAFQKQFGMSPSKYAAEQRAQQKNKVKEAYNE